MKNLLKPVVIFLLVAPASMVSFAADMAMDMQQGETSNKGMDMNMNKGMDMKKGMGMGMMGGMSDKKMRMMQEHMLMMHDLSNQILAEKDPATKKRLKEQQLELMKAHMKKMMGQRKSKMENNKKMK